MFDSSKEKQNTIPLDALAAKYGYTEYHIRRLARSGRVQGVRYGTKGEWCVDEASLRKYYEENTQRRFVQSTQDQKASKVPLPVLSHESSLSADPRNTTLTSASRIAKGKSKLYYGAERGYKNAIPKNLLLLVGGILFLINFIPTIESFDLNLNKSPIAKQYSQIKEPVSADIFSPLRNYVSK